MKPVLDDTEYSRLIARLDFHDTTRNSLLTFSFTTVITILGIALPLNLDDISVILCLMPYLLIIPFSARIVYYRLSSAHIHSFLRVYAPDKTKFEHGAQIVPEGSGPTYRLIAFLVNHEMFILALATNIVFYFKCFQCVAVWNWFNYLLVVISLILLFIVYFITNSTFNFNKMTQKYINDWTKQRNDLNE